MTLDWDALVAEMVATGEFHLSGLNVEMMQRDHEEGRDAIRINGSRITAYAAVENRTFTPCYPTYEIRRIYVAKGINGGGTAKKLVAELMWRFTPTLEEVSEKKKLMPTFFLISKNPAIWHIASCLGFRMVTKFNMPNVREWADEVGLGKRLPRSATARDPHHPRRRKRWLLIR